MSLKLILTRHAKSDWANPVLDDHDRPLNGRGRAAARLVGAWLAERDHLPGLALCSSAARTRETLAILAAALPEPPRQRILRELYLASADEMLALLRRHGRGETVLMLGHNPGTGVMARMLASAPPDDTEFVRYPTAYTTVFGFEADSWAEVDWGQGLVADHAAPRDLDT